MGVIKIVELPQLALYRDGPGIFSGRSEWTDELLAETPKKEEVVSANGVDFLVVSRKIENLFTLNISTGEIRDTWELLLFIKKEGEWYAVSGTTIITAEDLAPQIFGLMLTHAIGYGLEEAEDNSAQPADEGVP